GFSRQSGTVINRLSFTSTVLDSNLTVDPDIGQGASPGTTHISLGNVVVNGSRTLNLLDAINTANTAHGVDYTTLTGNASSVLTLTNNRANFAFSVVGNQSATMLGTAILPPCARTVVTPAITHAPD